MCSYAAVAQTSSAKRATDTRHEARVQEREKRAAAYEKQMETIVLSHSYTFTPTEFSMQPAGNPRTINNPNFQLAVYPDFTDVYLPYLKGVEPPYYITTWNYTISPNEYLAVQTDQGWTISFKSTMFSADTYTFTLNIYSSTGEAVLNISSNFYNTVTYNGSITSNN